MTLPLVSMSRQARSYKSTRTASTDAAANADRAKAGTGRTREPAREASELLEDRQSRAALDAGLTVHPAPPAQPVQPERVLI